jgi:hypothetical protein
MSGQAIFKYTRVRAMRRWAALNSRLGTGYTSAEAFQLIDLRCSIDKFITDSFHPSGRRSIWQVNAKQFRECCPRDLHRWYTPLMSSK